MQNPERVQVNIEDEWYGNESVGRYTGEPGIFLYYGDEGVDKDYTAMSVSRQIDGWGWTTKISGHGAHIVFSAIEGTETDPLDAGYTEEILAILQIQKHQTVRAVTSGNHIPTDDVDEVVEHYTVIVPDGEFRNSVDGDDDSFDWFANESKLRDRVDFVLGHSGKSRIPDDVRKLREKYLIPNERIWMYPEEDAGYEKVATVAKQTGIRMGLSPNYFKEKS